MRLINLNLKVLTAVEWIAEFEAWIQASIKVPAHAS